MRDHLIDAHITNVRKAGEVLRDARRVAATAYDEAVDRAEVEYNAAIADSEVVLETLTDQRNRELVTLAERQQALFTGSILTEPEPKPEAAARSTRPTTRISRSTRTTEKPRVFYGTWGASVDATIPTRQSQSEG